MASPETGPRRLYLFQVATDTIPIRDQPTDISAGCYLVQTADSRNILIDTGIPRDYAPPGAPPIRHGQDVIEQLNCLGITPGQIETVICTHFDIDHVGYHSSFPNAEFVVQSRHFAAAEKGGPRFELARPYWDAPGLRYRLVEGDTELLPGLCLIETSGHVTGHQSVLIDLPETGPVLLTIDAVPVASLFSRERVKTSMDEDEEDVRASARKLLDLVEREEIALTIFHHDGAQWERLRMAPEWYG